MNTLKKDWTAETTFSHVLSVIRCLLINPFPESSLNDEAGKLFMESYDEYSKRARLMTDVHGRPRSSVAPEGGEKRQKSGLKDDEDGDSPQRRKPGANPLASKNSNSISSTTTTSGKAGKTLGSKQASGKTKKKKNLKRL